MPWRKQGLWSDFVDGDAKTTGPWASEKPQDVDAMRKRIARFVCAGDGYLEDVNHTYGWYSTSMYKIFCEALPFACPVVRRALIHFCALDESTNKDVARFLEDCPLLSVLYLEGKDALMGMANLAVLLDGLSRNPYGKLRSITFSKIGNMPFDVQAQIRGALGRLSSLQQIQIAKCADEVVQVLCEGFRGHASLKCVKLHVALGSADMCTRFVSFLSSLPQLESFESHIHSDMLLEALPDSVSTLTSLILDHSRPNTGTEIAHVLRTTPALKDLDIRYYNPRTPRFIELNAALTQLPSLESLKIGTASEGCLVQCRRLKHLTCLLGVGVPPRRFDVLLERHPTLESLDLGGWLSDEDIRDLLHFLETNNDNRIKTLHIVQRDTSPEAANQLKRTLLANNILRDFSMNGTKTFVATMAEIFGNNSTSIERLCVKNLTCDPSCLLRSFKFNRTIKSLSLKFCSLKREAWLLLLELIASTENLKELDLRHSRSGDVDEFADALDKNSTLTTISVDKRDRTQPRWRFVSRLYARRNRVRQMVKQGGLPPGLWPTLFCALQPNHSALFLAMNCVHWPSLTGTTTYSCSAEREGTLNVPGRSI